MLAIEGLYKIYGDKLILDNINFNVDYKDFIVIIGPSGSGKTTLLKCINRLIKPTRGDVFYKGERITDGNINKIREKIGFVFQNYNLFNNLTVFENITFAPLKRKLCSIEDATNKANKLLKEFGIEDKIDEIPSNLSGGEKQRVAIIRALMMDPDVLLFDEPTSALDPEIVDDFFRILKKLNKNGMTLIVVSHEMRFIKELNPDIIYLEDGKIIEHGKYNKIIKNTKNKSLIKFLDKVE